MIEILSPISKGLMQLTGVLSIGLLLSNCFLDKDVKGGVHNSKLAKRAKNFILVWLIATFLYVLVQISYLLEQPFLSSFDITVIRSYLTQTSIGKSAKINCATKI